MDRKYTFDEYRLARCPRIVGGSMRSGATPPPLPMLMAKLIENCQTTVCDGFCTYTNDCPAGDLLKSQQSFATVQPIFTNTVKEEAIRLGISIGAVRKMRRGQ